MRGRRMRARICRISDGARIKHLSIEAALRHANHMDMDMDMDMDQVR